MEWFVGYSAPSFAKNPVYVRTRYIGYVTRDRTNAKKYVACFYTGEILREQFTTFEAAQSALRQLYKRKINEQKTAAHSPSD